MKTVTLKAARVYELVTILDILTPRDLPTLKDMRLASGVVRVLREVAPEFTEINDAYNKKRNEIAAPFAERITKGKEGKTEEEVKVLESEINKEFLAKVGVELDEFIKKLEALKDEEKTFELSDDRWDKLVELFKKNTDKYTRKDIVIEVADALGVAE